MKDRNGRPWGWAALRDLLLVSLALFALLWAGRRSGAIAAAHQRLADLLPRHAGEALIGLVLGMAALALFAALRWRAARRRLSARAREEGRFTLLVENLPAVSCTWDPRRSVGTTPPVYVSPQAEPILGLPVREWRARPGLRIERLHPEDRARVVREWNRAARRGEGFQIEYRHIRPDGIPIWIREEAIVVERDSSGDATLLQSLLHDVTERKRSEAHLAQAEARYRTLVERVPAVTYTWSDAVRSGAETSAYISPQVELLLGYAPAAFADPALWERLIHHDDLDRVMTQWEECRRVERAFACEYRMRTRDGATVWSATRRFPSAGTMQAAHCSRA